MTSPPLVLAAFTRRVLVVVGVVSLAVVLLVFLRQVARVLLLVFAGVLLAVFFRGQAVVLAQRTPLSVRGAAVGVVLLWGALAWLSLWLAVPALAAQLDTLGDEALRTLEGVRAWLAQYGWGRALLVHLGPVSGWTVRLGSLLPALADVGGAVVEGLVATLLILVVGLYLTFTPGLYLGGVLLLVPAAHRLHARQVLDALGQALRWWLVGQLSAMALVGVLTALGLWLLDIPLALTLGVTAAVLAFIPNIGPALSVVPAILVGLASGGARGALTVVALYVAIQTVESYLLTPLIQRKAVFLPPALLITFEVAMGVLAGTLGLLLATPLLVVGMVLVQGLYVRAALATEVTLLGER